MKFCENERCAYHVDCPEGTNALELPLPHGETMHQYRKTIVDKVSGKCFNFCGGCANAVAMINQVTKNEN